MDLTNQTKMYYKELKFVSDLDNKYKNYNFLRFIVTPNPFSEPLYNICLSFRNKKDLNYYKKMINSEIDKFDVDFNTGIKTYIKSFATPFDRDVKKIDLIIEIKSSIMNNKEFRKLFFDSMDPIFSVIKSIDDLKKPFI